MWRFGRYGNGSSIMDASNRFGVSEGIIDKATKRVIRAILSLQTKYLSWYSTEEKIEIKNNI
jgi:transposase